jgi:hypothetical protein
MRWRRICLEVREDGEVIGAAMEEHLEGFKVAEHVFLLGPSPRQSPEVLLRRILAEPWPDSKRYLVSSEKLPELLDQLELEYEALHLFEADEPDPFPQLRPQLRREINGG